jgi:cyanophycin synthetase
LRRAANFALGGTVIRVEEEIHPDNLDLCCRAMRLLRLDLAGLDLLMPDITRSWREVGGVICEINAQPFIGSVLSRNVYAEILQQLVPGTGRIPLVLFVGELDHATTEALAARVPQLAVVDAQGARLNGHPLTASGAPWLNACEAALLDQQVGAALLVLPSAANAPVLSPVDRFSAAYLAAGAIAGEEDLSAGLIALLRRADGNLAAAAEHGPALDRAGLDWRVADAGNLVDDLVAGLS